MRVGVEALARVEPLREIVVARLRQASVALVPVPRPQVDSLRVAARAALQQRRAQLHGDLNRINGALDERRRAALARLTRPVEAFATAGRRLAEIGRTMERRVQLINCATHIDQQLTGIDATLAAAKVGVAEALQQRRAGIDPPPEIDARLADANPKTRVRRSSPRTAARAADLPAGLMPHPCVCRTGVRAA